MENLELCRWGKHSKLPHGVWILGQQAATLLVKNILIACQNFDEAAWKQCNLSTVYLKHTVYLLHYQSHLICNNHGRAVCCSHSMDMTSILWKEHMKNKTNLGTCCNQMSFECWFFVSLLKTFPSFFSILNLTLFNLMVILLKNLVLKLAFERFEIVCKHWKRVCTKTSRVDSAANAFLLLMRQE